MNNRKMRIAVYEVMKTLSYNPILKGKSTPK
jgi:hypothetical protein